MPANLDKKLVNYSYLRISFPFFHPTSLYPSFAVGSLSPADGRRKKSPAGAPSPLGVRVGGAGRASWVGGVVPLPSQLALAVFVLV